MTLTQDDPMRQATFMLTLFLPWTLSGTLAAQGPSPTRLPAGWAIGGSVQRVGWFDEFATSTLTLRATNLAKEGIGADFAFSVFPAGFSDGALVFLTDVGLVVPARLSRVTVFARGGASVLAAVAQGGGGGAFNVYAGAGTIIQIAPSIGLRFDVERRFLAGADPGYGFFVVGMGITTIPRDRTPEG
ncbi:MAG: hypothetical protein E4H37_00815 [Gemmatimonadales bacterium]|nr:MAG: hypothetical protein E4H37_00815 [Gemmatimonadales bacterium]